MQLEARKYLHDIQQAAALLSSFVAGKRFEDYVKDPLLKAAVERKFEIIGEALTQLAKLDVTLAAKITNHRRIIAFRNILIHGYAEVEDRLVWDVLERKLPMLRQEVDALVREP